MEFPVNSLGGGKYVLVVTDDYSKWCGVKVLKSKAHAKAELMHILNQWMTLTSEKVHTLRSDRGGEFINAEMHDYLSEKSMKQALHMHISRMARLREPIGHSPTL
jgi:hypothetical protein